MASKGIRDQVAIVGMGCTTFGEHWDRSTDDMLVDSSSEALKSAGIPLSDVDAKDVAIGDRVEMTFRRLSSADGVHNYFWKGKPVRSVAAEEGS